MADPSEPQYEETPKGWAQRWKVELDAAKKELSPFWEQGEEALKWFLDKPDANRAAKKGHWNVYTVNIQVLRALLFGRPPQVEVARRWADADDDVARVGGVIQQRLLNCDIERASDTYAAALKNALGDRLVPGLGCTRVRFQADFEEVPAVPAMTQPDPATGEPKEMAPEVPATKKAKNEEVPIDHVHWRDFLYSPCRTWAECRWVAFRNFVIRQAGVKKFGDAFKDVPIATKPPESANRDGQANTPWDRAEVWEIWSKEDKKVFWYVEGFDSVLTPVDVTANEDGSQDDPLGLDDFWPCPEPMLANVTSSSQVPRSDFILTRDQYEELDLVSERISQLVKALKVAGVYNGAYPELQKLVEAGPNIMIPVQNWDALAEKGGIRAAVDWFPLDAVVAALDKLRDYRSEVLEGIYQLTGLSDMMRGQGQGAGVTATEQKIKAKFGAVRVQALQDEFARHASDLQRLKAEIIAKHFSDETIIARSNIQYTADGQDMPLVQQAVQLIKSKQSAYRIEVKPEAISLPDFAELKQERSEFVTTLAQFATAMAPVGQTMPGALPFMLNIVKWAVAGFRGASTIEGEFDRAIKAAEKAAQNPQPPPQQQTDPSAQTKLLTQQLKGQQDMAKVQAELQADLVRTQADTQADAQREQAQAYWNTKEAVAKHRAIASQPQPPFGGGTAGGGST